MKSDSGKTGTPDLLLERYRLNEVSPAERAEVERQLRENEAVRRRLAEIERSDEAMREGDFASSLAKQVRERAAEKATRGGPGQPSTARASSRVLPWALPAAVAATVMVVVVIGSRIGGSRPDDAGERIKGLRPSLSLFRQTPRGSETVADKATAREGDVVRLAYRAAGQAYGVIVSIDGRGAVTVHLPPAGREAVRLQPGDNVLLDSAYELDDAPRFECFYFVTAREPFDTQPVIEAAKQAAAIDHPVSPPARLPLPRQFAQSMFVLQKEH